MTTSPQSLILPGEPCPPHPHVHVWLEPWLVLRGETHETARLHIRSCHGGTPLAAYVQTIVGIEWRPHYGAERSVPFWQRLWWHLTRTGPQSSHV
jgi:hypothetical protein